MVLYLLNYNIYDTVIPLNIDPGWRQGFYKNNITEIAHSAFEKAESKDVIKAQLENLFEKYVSNLKSNKGNFPIISRENRCTYIDSMVTILASKLVCNSDSGVSDISPEDLKLISLTPHKKKSLLAPIISKLDQTQIKNYVDTSIIIEKRKTYFERCNKFDINHLKQLILEPLYDNRELKTILEAYIEICCEKKPDFNQNDLNKEPLTLSGAPPYLVVNHLTSLIDLFNVIKSKFNPNLPETGCNLQSNNSTNNSNSTNNPNSTNVSNLSNTVLNQSSERIPSQEGHDNNNQQMGASHQTTVDSPQVNSTQFIVNSQTGTNNSFDPNVSNQLQTSTKSVSDINMPIIVNLNHDYSQMSDTDYPNLSQDYNNPISKRPRLSDSYV
ncbi:hypothetical protein ACTFIZ_009512 [Dictyostelium cf. discoideum]